jgi:hypothetical protein
MSTAAEDRVEVCNMAGLHASSWWTFKAFTVALRDVAIMREEVCRRYPSAV